MRTIKYVAVLAMLSLFVTWSAQAVVVESECRNLPNTPAIPVAQVAQEDVSVPNDYDQVVEEDTREGVVYLTVVNGASPTPNACGLIATNDPAEWMGWGGPLDGDNVTIGEGGGTRNEIVIGGVYFPRGIGTHAAAKLVYDLTGADYTSFSVYAGMSDEKDPDQCGAGGTSAFIFSVDGVEMAKTDTLPGSANGENVPPELIEFDIPGGAGELVIEITNGDDGAGCDHAALGDAKLLTSAVTAVESTGKLTISWGAIKKLY